MIPTGVTGGLSEISQLSQIKNICSYLGEGVHDIVLLGLGLPKVVEVEGTDLEV